MKINRFAVFGAALLLTGAYAGNAFSADEDLIYLTEPAGQSLFEDSEIKSDYYPLASYLETQKVVTFCGPATIANVLNSLDVPRPPVKLLSPYGYFTQDNVFTPENQEVKGYLGVFTSGMNLEQLATFFVNLGVQSDFHYASDLTTDELRDIVKDTLQDTDKRLVINYTRQAIDQDGGGHISPVAAYDEDNDKVLILDVAKYKYPPVWITTSELHDAMSGIDTDSNLSRGIVVVSK